MGMSIARTYAMFPSTCIRARTIFLYLMLHVQDFILYEMEALAQFENRSENSTPALMSRPT